MTALIDTIELALATLRSNPLRSLLTLLGIVIGAGTVVAMMSLTEGLRQKVAHDFGALGAGAFHIQKYPAIGMPSTDWRKYEKRKSLTVAQGRAIKERCPHVAGVSFEAYLYPPERVVHGDRATKPNIWIMGTNPEFEPVSGYSVAEGRFLSETDLVLERRVAVLGADVADLLFPGASPLGQKVRIRSSSFTVIGVLARMGTVFGLESKDTLALTPLPVFELEFGSKHELELGVLAATPDVMSVAQDEAEVLLRRMRGVKDREENDFEIFTNDTLTSMFDNIATTIAAATFGVCALALLVGGIGIMNIMLVSVVERTREIGIRKALGARRRRILSQFVVEAVALSFLGGAIGVTLGGSLAIVARELYQVPASVPMWAVMLSLGCSVGSGLAFGIYPAVRASKLDPVEAMRVE